MVDKIFDIAIIGGGIIGCSLAKTFGKRFRKVLLIEKESHVGFHTSGRNSGVVHSGFNAKPGTLKAKLCVEGNKEIRNYCKERNVPFEQVGTYVVALDENQARILVELKNRGDKNDVPGLEILPIEKVRKKEPNIKGVAALFSPTGSIVNSSLLTQYLADDAEQLGVDMKLGQEVIQIKENKEFVELVTKDSAYMAQMVVNCAGLHADRLAHMMGVGRDYVIAPFRGEYFIVNQSGSPIINSMVYPVPNPIVPFLGVHLTKNIDGSVLIGPNAVPAFGREAYKRTDINIKDLIEIFTHKGTWNALVGNRDLVKIAWNELKNSCNKQHFLKEADRLVKGLTMKSLALGSRVGIRPQLIQRNGQLVEDLVVETTSRSIHILNVVSPGMTSALSFARWFSDRINNDLQWCPPKEMLTEINQL